MLFRVEYEDDYVTSRPGPQAIKLFSCSTQLSMKFKLLTKTKIPTNEEVSQMFYLSYLFMLKCCWHFNIYEQDKFRAPLSCAWKKFYIFEGRFLESKLITKASCEFQSRTFKSFFLGNRQYVSQLVLLTHILYYYIVRLISKHQYALLKWHNLATAI